MAGVNHITIAVRDLTRYVVFYADILGMKLVAQWDRGAYLLGGQTWIALNLDDHVVAAADCSHVAFSVAASEIGPLADRIMRAGGTEWRAARDGRSFYFTDPDGHRHELHASDLNGRLAEFALDPPGEFEVLR